MNKPLFIAFALISLFCNPVLGQEASLSGSYINATGTIGLRLKPVTSGYHGLLQASGSNFALEGTGTGYQLSGTVYGNSGPSPFTLSLQTSGLVMSAFGYTETFFQVSADHELADVDLSPYMQTPGQISPDGQGDYDYSYSQSSPGYANEQYQTYPHSATAASSPYPAHEDAELMGLIGGSQVVYYARTSYLNDNTASSITYVNFCRDGRFWLNYDGSFSVEGNFYGNAQGASMGRNSGTWQLVTYQGQPAVYMAYSNGETAVNPVYKHLIYQGRWRIGNTQYAIQQNKVNCR